MKSSLPPLLFDRQKWGIRIRDVYFSKKDSQVSKRGADLLCYLQANNPGKRGTKFYTSIIQLNKSEDALFEGIYKSFRYEIRRAIEKDSLECQITSPDSVSLADFFAFYDRFASSRGLPVVNRPKLEGLNSAGALKLAQVRSSTGILLAAHLYLHTPERARLYHSAGLNGDQAERQLVGRANKLLHWKGLQHFREFGVAECDLGGLGMTEAMRALDQFKQHFGGIETLEYNRIEAGSPLGHLLLSLLRLRRLFQRKQPEKNI